MVDILTKCAGRSSTDRSTPSRVAAQLAHNKPSTQNAQDAGLGRDMKRMSLNGSSEYSVI